jgi:hypothetical protein
MEFFNNINIIVSILAGCITISQAVLAIVGFNRDRKTTSPPPQMQYPLRQPYPSQWGSNQWNLIVRKRPVGVTLLAIMIGLQAVVILFRVLVLPFSDIGMTFGAEVIIPTALLGLTIASVQGILIWGLWTLRRWAFWATVIYGFLLIVFSLCALSVPTSGIIGIFIIVQSVIFLVCLFGNRSVRAVFRS